MLVNCLPGASGTNIGSLVGGDCPWEVVGGVGNLFGGTDVRVLGDKKGAWFFVVSGAGGEPRGGDTTERWRKRPLIIKP